MADLGNPAQGNDNLNAPIPFDDGPEAPAPQKDGPSGGAPAVSRAPLNLGGAGAVKPAPSPVLRPQAPPPVARRPAVAAAGADRITGCKTFFTKLHPGAIEFLDEQITGWLKENAGISIKHTNVTTGEVQAKKTEPNILITVWY